MTDTKISGTIFDIQHFSVHDGPGIRTTIFFKGCPLRCEWCHNPESYIAHPQILFYPEQCVHCGNCTSVCPSDCHSFRSEIHEYHRQPCTSCGQCASACPTGALKTVGKSMSVDHILEEVMEDYFFYESSGGGLTLSGGEPMLQPEFTLALLKRAKEKGLHTCTETSGFCDTRHLQQIQPYVDIFLYDYKVTGDENHQKYTGVTQELILQNLYLLDRLGAPIVLRCPMIPGKNINSQHVSGIIHVAQQLKNLLEIHLEPYHNIGISKRLGLGLTEHNQVLLPPTHEELMTIAKEIQECVSVPVKIL